MFTVVIPLFNKIKFIERAINSVRNQSFKDFEIIVVDDGSTDGSAELVKTLFEDEVKLIRQANQGVSAARNIGINLANYSFIVFLDADDFWHKDYLYSVKNLISRYPNAGIIGVSYIFKGEFPQKIQDNFSIISNYFKNADRNTLFTSSSTVIQKSFFENNTGFKVNLRKGEDIDVWCRAYDYFGKAYFINNALVFYDITASDSSNHVYPVVSHFLHEMYSNYSISEQNKKDWIEFRDKYLLLNLLFNLRDKKKYNEYINLLDALDKTYFLAKIIYWLPQVFFEKRFFLKYSRLYLKFCFRYIYK